jgi:hypothetical protein
VKNNVTWYGVQDRRKMMVVRRRVDL